MYFIFFFKILSIFNPREKNEECLKETDSNVYLKRPHLLIKINIIFTSKLNSWHLPSFITIQVYIKFIFLMEYKFKVVGQT